MCVIPCAIGIYYTDTKYLDIDRANNYRKKVKEEIERTYKNEDKIKEEQEKQEKKQKELKAK